MYIIMLGAPGSGKGTTAKVLAERTNLPHISTGDMFREQIKNGTELGKEQAEALASILQEKGKQVDIVPELVVPDQVIIDRILNRATCSNKECGAIYNTKFKPSKVPGVCDKCGSALVTRTDDNEEAIKTRLEVYRENSKDLIAYYKEKGVLVTITPENPNAENSTEQVINTILEAIKR